VLQTYINTRSLARAHTHACTHSFFFSLTHSLSHPPPMHFLSQVEASRTAAADDIQSIVAPLIKGGCYYIRVSAINGGGTGPPMVGGAGCVTVVEAPTEVSNVSIKALSDTMLLAQWNPPLDSGDGTADGIDILGYLVESLVLATGQLHEAHNIPPTQLHQVKPWTLNPIP